MVFHTAEHEGEEELESLLLETLVFFINHQAGRSLVKERNDAKDSIWPVGVDLR